MLLDQYGKPLKTPAKMAKVRGYYDSAQTNEENYRHWGMADSMSANAANDKSTRQTLRDRARYEAANNSYCGGLLDTFANDIVGTGPRLQLIIPGVARSVSRSIERLHSQWRNEIDLADKLRVGAKTKMRDGEVFGLTVNNPNIDPFLPSLDLRLYEAEQVSTPDLFRHQFDPLRLDGIVRDEFGNVVEYHFLDNHPGSDYAWRNLTKYRTIPANRVVHWYRADRPGQARGVPEITAALPLFAQMRRYTLATITAAEFAACLTAMLETDSAATYSSDSDADTATAEFDRVPMERGTALTLPKGWKANQLKAEQPVSTYGDFKHEILNEIGRSVSAPFNVVAGNSSGYNYSSGRLDHLIYHRTIRIERSRCRSRVLDPLFKSWLKEAFGMRLFREELPPISQWSWEWYWDGFESIDPMKDAAANKQLLDSNQTTYAEIYAEFGQDWEEQFEQRARENARIKELGLMPLPTAPESQPIQFEEVESE